ncbi:Imm63 family immunity protein [Agromyces larvae]|uniref:Immunity 63 family protein n=1 Tax=Agromyces larvae TaxID=2929802 RepID=A0ABY4C0K1_9MICO|nr:Imm63 family immunity protein [Agromyces larvae]UOE44928.1 immunity 63 family protein [Agromyces larvae]
MSVAASERQFDLPAVLAELDGWYDRLERLTGESIQWKVDDVNRDAAYPFIEVDDGVHRYLAFERGRECLRRETTDLDELVFWVMDSHVHQIAWNAVPRTRRRPPGFTGDTRRLWFPEWEALMTALSPAWGERTRRRIDEILSRSPYHD